MSLRPQHLHRLIARSLHRSSPLSARLVDSSTSLTRGPEQLPPSPPRPLRPSQSLAPEVPHETNSLLEEVRFGDASTREDLGSIVALDLFLLRALAQLQGGEMDLSSMLEEMRAKDGLVLDSELEYESRPGDERRVRAGVGEEELRREGEQDGIVVVAHVLGGEDPRVSVCSGFKVGETKPGEGDAIITCAHTLQAMAPYVPPSTKSATFILTATGHIFPVLSLSSALPSSDLLLLRLSPTPLRDPSFSASPLRPNSTSPPRPSRPIPTLRSLPMSPYPAVAGTRIASLVYRHPMAQRNGGAKKRDWAAGRIVEYKNAIGGVAEAGTYDDLSSVSITTIPTPGSSGGPIVDLDTGAVVGIIRGSTKSYGDRGVRGFGTPAEKVFDMFKLPGFTAKRGVRAKVEKGREARTKRN